MRTTVTRPYTNKELDRIEQKLIDDFNRREPTQYDVRVDGLLIIERTDDPERFAIIPDNVDYTSSEKVEIRLFQGNSLHNTTFELILERNRPGKDRGVTLEGLQTHIQAAIAKEKEKWEADQLKQDFETLKAEYKELEEYADKLEEEVKMFRAKKLHLGNVNLVDLGGMLLEGMIRRNPGVLNRLPGGEALAGAIEADNEQQMQMAQNPAPEEQATFSRADEPDELTTQDRAYLEMLRRIQDAFSSNDFLSVMRILEMLIAQPAMIPQVIAMLEGTARPATNPGNSAQHDHIDNLTEELPDDL